MRLYFASAIVGFLCTIGTRYSIAEPIPESFDKNIVQFIFIKTGPTNYIPNGTCFLVDTKSEHRVASKIFGLKWGGTAYTVTTHAPYFVTAKHVLFDPSGTLRPNLYVRSGLRKGGVNFYGINDSISNNLFRIILHTNETVDLAVIAFTKSAVESAFGKKVTATDIASPNEIYKVGVFDSALFTDNKSFQKLSIREGEEMFFVGLFQPFYGSEENIPICHFGRLSMPTDERIPIPGSGRTSNMYVMDAPVIPGNSGSPTFFYFSKGRVRGTPILLAGVVSGVWPNTGVSVVTPAYFLGDIVFSKEEKQFRYECLKRYFPDEKAP